MRYFTFFHTVFEMSCVLKHGHISVEISCFQVVPRDGSHPGGMSHTDLELKGEDLGAGDQGAVRAL
jgi:hypothetical protein